MAPWAYRPVARSVMATPTRVGSPFCRNTTHLNSHTFCSALSIYKMGETQYVLYCKITIHSCDEFFNPSPIIFNALNTNTQHRYILWSKCFDAILVYICSKSHFSRNHGLLLPEKGFVEVKLVYDLKHCTSGPVMCMSPLIAAAMTSYPALRAYGPVPPKPVIEQ